MPTFLVLNAGAVGVALLAAMAAGTNRPVSRLLLATLSGYLVAIYLMTLLAGLTGYLSAAGLLLALAAALALAGGLGLRAVARRRTVTPTVEVAEPRRRLGPAGLVAVLVASGAGVAWAWPHLAQATRLWVWDDYTYHMVYPALWLREGAIAATAPAETFTMQAWYPLGASVVAAWFMAPFFPARGEALAWVSLTGPLHAAIVLASGAELLARLGCRPGAWAVPLVLFATSSRVAIMGESFSDADLAQAAALFGAFAVAVPRPDAAGGTADTWYAALLTGFALAVKVSAAPVALVILVMVALRVREDGSRAIVRTALVFALAWAVMAGFWYGRNVLHTGNPVYPAAGLFWPGTTFPETTLLEYARRYGVGRTLADALAVYLNWPRLHATLALLGLAGLAIRLLGRRRALSPAERAFGLGALAITGVVLLLLPATPYSAGNALTFRSGFVHWDSMRYVAVLPFLGWVALGFLLAGPDWRARPGPNAGRPRPDPAARTGITARGLPGPATLGLGGVVIGTLVVGALVAGLHRHKAAATAAWIHGEPLFGPAAGVLDGQPAGTRVAVFGDQWIHPAFGDRHHLRPVRMDGDGRIAGRPVGDSMGPGEPGVDPATFRANLRASGIGVVVIVRQPHPGRSPAFPGQHRALEVSGDARLLHQDRAVAVWSLGP